MKYNEEPKIIKVGYDLDNKEDHKIIREFEMMFERLKTKPLKCPLEFYGEPCEKLPAIELGKYKFPENIKPRRVYTNVTGLIDAGIIQYLLGIKAVSRHNVTKDHPGYGWAVGPDLKAYEDFYQKKGALDELRHRREYAKEKEQESFDALVKSREALSKSMEMPK